MSVDAAVLAAIASPRRREILRMVWQAELSAGDIARAMPDVTFGAVSLQLRALLAARLVTVRVEDRHRFYRAHLQPLGPAALMLEEMWSDALWSLKLAAELEESRRGPQRVRSNAKSNTASTSASQSSPRKRSTTKQLTIKKSTTKRAARKTSPGKKRKLK